MKTISVIIDYSVISPVDLMERVFSNLMGWYDWRRMTTDSYEFSVFCRQEDASWVEDRLAQYV